MILEIDLTVVNLENVFTLDVDEQGHKEKPYRVIVTSTSGARKTFAFSKAGPAEQLHHEITVALRKYAAIKYVNQKQVYEQL